MDVATNARHRPRAPGRGLPWRCAALPLLAPVLAHADNAPLSYLRTYGPSGDPATRLGHGLGWISIAVMLIIAVLLLAALLRQRAPLPAPSALAVAMDAGGMGWIYVGVGLSTLVLLLCIGWTFHTSAALREPAAAGQLTIRVIAHQWWWDVHYLDPEPSRMLTTANEIHIPVGQPVRIELASDDVVHSFWIPQLGGKTDVIPGQVNSKWLQADRPGLYTGHCGEYCGRSHANMMMHIVAEPAAQFASWREHQLLALTDRNPATIPGLLLVEIRCGGCHSIRGTAAHGRVGPDLTHLMSRQHIAGGLLANSPANLERWIRRPDAVKPGALMPTVPLSDAELGQVLGFLQSLK